MKKKIINLLKWCFLIGILSIPALIIVFWLYAYRIGFPGLGVNDTIVDLSDGKYEIGSFTNNRIALEDYRFDGLMKILVGEIERYVIKDESIYIVGDYGEGDAIRKDGTHLKPSRYRHYETGELKFYQPGDPVAHYIILNLETDELKKYVDWEDVPEADQIIFQQAKAQEEGLNVIK